MAWRKMMDNKGRTYLFTLLVLASVLVLVTAVSYVSAGGGKNKACGDGVCDAAAGETETTCPLDCLPVQPMSLAAACHMYFNGPGEVGLAKIAGQSNIAKYNVGTSNCADLYQNLWVDQTDYGAFHTFYTNNCGCDDAYGVGCDVPVIDNTGCGWGNKGCGHNPDGYAVECLVNTGTQQNSGGMQPMFPSTTIGSYSPVLSPTEKVAGSARVFTEDTTPFAANGCGSICTYGGAKYFHPDSRTGQCFYVNYNNYPPC